MSLKSFLQMQEGGQTFVSPFAQPDPTGTTKAVTPRQRPNLTFEAITGINRKDTSPTITIEDRNDQYPKYLPIDRIHEYKEKKPENFDPGVGNNISVHGYNAQSPEVTAAAAAMGIQITGFENAGFYDTLVAMNQPETPFSRGLDKYVGPALPITPKGTLGSSLALIPVVGPIALTAQRTLEAARSARSGEPIFGTSKAATPPTTSKATTSAAPIAGPAPLGYTYPGGGFGATVTAAPVGYTYSGGGFGATVTAAPPTFSGTTGMSAAQIGSEMFGVAYGMGGEISPGFAIGGRGSFTSFAHYGAGISQADEISIVSNSAPGVFASVESGKDAIDGLVAGGYNESEITAIAQTGQYAGLDYAEGSKDDGSSQSIGKFAIDEGKYSDTSGGDFSGGGGTQVICTQLFSMGIMSANLYQGEGEHAKNIPNVIRRGYHFWAVPFVRGMRKNQLLFKLGKTLGLSWAQYAAHKANPDKFAPNYLGTFINAIGIPICAALGLFVGETDWETLWIDYEKGNGLCLDQQN
jgi:hypothetical protein